VTQPTADDSLLYALYLASADLHSMVERARAMTRHSDAHSGIGASPLSWRFLSEAAQLLEVHHVVEDGTLARSVVTWASDQFDFDCPLVYAFDGGAKEVHGC
jgi:hypothetical protein